MWGEAVSVMDGQLVSYCFGLLGVLLPFGPSWFLHSGPVPFDGKSGFVSHTKHIVEATNMDLFYS